ncbi:putative DNA polymerase alpha/delta/epsilon, subunit B, DNA polymerase alpha, subunit B [Helianthus anomalus]
MEDQIRAEFRKNNFVLVEEEAILQKCVTFCINYNLSPSDLVSSWDLYSINRQLELIVSDAHMDAFRQQLQSEQKQAIIEKEQGLHSYTDVTMEIDNDNEDAKEVVPASPTVQKDVNLDSFDVTPLTNGKIHSLGRPLELVTPFGQRKDKFVVHSTLNNLPTVDDIKKEHGEDNSDDDVIKRVQPIKRCSLEIIGSQPARGCRYMYDRIEDKFNYLEDRIMKYSEALVASQLYDELVDPSVASQKTIFSVGMICCEEEGRLKEKPIMLQSSVEHSGGQRVRLELQKLEQFSIFPGQVVGVEGHNPSGHCLIATKIVDYVPLSVPDDTFRQTKRQAVDQDNQLVDPSDVSSDLSLIIASGPFTTTDNLFFEPLSDLLAYARRRQPQLLVLLGPFIDSEHPEIKKGALNKTYDELFRLEVFKRLQDYVEYMGSAARVILVPSVRDAHHDHVFPQPAFDINLADINDQITCITNPGIISANKVKVGCCSVDVLKQLSTDVVSRGIKNRMNTLTNHLLSQRSFYPLYPPAEDTPVDLSLAPEAFQMSVIPDVLVVPSDLTQFVKVLSLEGTSEVKCICVNPGRLARGEGGGHFVEVNFHGSPDCSSASVIRI